jgi:hypothetical protein
MSYKSILLKNIQKNDKEYYETSSSDEEMKLSNFNKRLNHTKVNHTKVNHTKKNEALLKAQDVLVNSCLPNDKMSNKIFKNMNNDKCKGFNVKIDISNNLIFIKHCGKTYKFEKNRFFTKPNVKHFKWHLINAYTNKFGNNIWIKLEQEDEMKYIIKISKRNFI